jgi:voltage-gated potassium channel
VPRQRRVIQRFLRELTLRRAIGGIVAVALAFTLVAAAAMRIVEPDRYETYGDACWWAIQTVSTVGYGDNTPVSAGGKIVATVTMLFGIALVPAITSLVVAVFINQQTGRFQDN